MALARPSFCKKISLEPVKVIQHERTYRDRSPNLSVCRSHQASGSQCHICLPHPERASAGHPSRCVDPYPHPCTLALPHRVARHGRRILTMRESHLRFRCLHVLSMGCSVMMLSLNTYDDCCVGILCSLVDCALALRLSACLSAGSLVEGFPAAS